MDRPLDVAALRRQFPGLARRHGEHSALFLDGPAGSQVPASVAAAVADWLLHHNANHGGSFATSRETDAMVGHARDAFAALFGGAADEVVFGPNMTTLTLQLSRALAKTWRAGDEIVVTDSDHDANVTPWVLAARDAGAAVQRVGLLGDGTLDLDDCRRKLGARTRLVAVAGASNLTGTIHPVAEVAAAARRHGALVFVDAVHYAAHCRIDVAAWGCDFAVCSAYKFFGPHLGILWGKRELLERLEAYKVRPADAHGPGKWETGTANFEGIAGALAAVEYLTQIGRDAGATGPRRALLDAAFAATTAHERELCARLLRGLLALPELRIVGITAPARLHDRCATVSFVPAGTTPQALGDELAQRGIFCWAGHSYAVALTAALGLEPHGVLRVGLLHYHTADEVDRLLLELRTALTCVRRANP